MSDVILNEFTTKSLEDISSVSLQNRVDDKYTITRATLNPLLERLKETHDIVEIDNLCSLPYKSLYFDTPELNCYTGHHNGKRNRYKFRTREYISSNVIFNEIKHKTNKGKTHKSRIRRSAFSESMDEKFQNFTLEKCDSSEEYAPQLYIEYNRITLVDKELTERITIDTDLRVTDYDDSNKTRSFNNLVIVERKWDRNNKTSLSMRAFREFRCKKRRFSKYCIGIALLKDGAKTNLFKEKIRFIEKMENL